MQTTKRGEEAWDVAGVSGLNNLLATYTNHGWGLLKNRIDLGIGTVTYIGCIKFVQTIDARGCILSKTAQGPDLSTRD